MSFFAELKAANASEWNDYIDHAFVRHLDAGTLPLANFQDYLVQDYHFLVHFARAYALAAFKSRTLHDIRNAHEGLALIVRETELHVGLTERWGLTRGEVESTPEKPGTVAYTRYVLDTGLAGDLLDLHVALAPCVIGYAEIGRRLEPSLDEVADHPYREWIETYASDGFQAGAQAEIRVIDTLAERFLTDSRRAVISRIFATATRMESAFWQQALHEAGASSHA
ncbi:thiaminase II [Pseudactinotalea sp. Z1748]|uniref:thiaminase II n=1 Tax=Pseudactinotalea sp. Z1748 TaxID=3413027 RepID=UPI003C7E711D